MKYSFIQFRFLCSADSKAHEDHVINIKRNGDEYLWIWRDEVKHRVQTMWLTRDDLREQLITVVDLMSFDAHPYSAVQLFLPAMPTVLIEAGRFHAAFSTVWRSMERCFDNWPENMTAKEAYELDTDDVYDDEDYEADDDNESEDDDSSVSSDSSSESFSSMPPLIPNFRCPTVCEEKCWGGCPNTPQRPKKTPVCPGAPERCAKRVTLNEVVDLSNNPVYDNKTTALYNMAAAIASDNPSELRQAIFKASLAGLTESHPAMNIALRTLETLEMNVPKAYRKIEKTPNGDRVHTFYE